MRTICLLVVLICNTALGEMRVEDFGTDPGWTIVGSGISGNELGWFSTNFAGGEPGEIGGWFTRSDHIRYIADTDIGTVPLSETIRAEGIFNYDEKNDPDFGNGFVLGHFSTTPTLTNDNGVRIGMGFTDGGTPYLNAMGVVAVDDGNSVSVGYVELIPGDMLTWSYELEPNLDGTGTFTITLNGTEYNMDIDSATMSEITQPINAFGIIGSNASNPTHLRYAEVYADNLMYSIGAHAPEPSTLLLGLVLVLGAALLKKEVK